MNVPKATKENLQRLVAESPVHGPIVIAELIALRAIVETDKRVETEVRKTVEKSWRPGPC